MHVPNGLTKCVQLELARDPPDYDAQDESIDIAITLSHFPSHNSTEPTRLHPPVRPGTSLQGQISFGEMPAGTFTFPALAVDAAYADSNPNVGGPHHPSTMMSFLNLGQHLPSSHRVAPGMISICYADRTHTHSHTHTRTQQHYPRVWATAGTSAASQYRRPVWRN